MTQYRAKPSSETPRNCKQPLCVEMLRSKKFKTPISARTAARCSIYSPRQQVRLREEPRAPYPQPSGASLPPFLCKHMHTHAWRQKIIILVSHDVHGRFAEPSEDRTLHKWHARLQQQLQPPPQSANVCLFRKGQ